MGDKEIKLSDYIDSLNEERRPEAHGGDVKAKEFEDMLKTVRMVRSLREPSLPEGNFGKRLAAGVKRKQLRDKLKPRRWFTGIVATAAAVALIIIFNTLAPLGSTNMVYAMEKAFKGIKAYHGVLEVVEVNAEGKSMAQSRLEVWSDKEGRYYVKGLEGYQRNVVTVNNGKRKWQIQPGEGEVDLFVAFPDPYSFTFEIGREIEDVKNAVKTKVVGDDKVAGRAAVVMEVTPQGGSPYRIWVDKETKMPLQKQSAMEYSLQYTVRYESIDFTENIPEELLAYAVPSGFKETSMNRDQIVGSLEEAGKLSGFVPRTVENIPQPFAVNSMSVLKDIKAVKIDYTSRDNNQRVSVIQRKATVEFKPSSMAVLGRINGSLAEIQSPVQSEEGVLQGGAYAGVTEISSVRWQEDGIEYAVVGNTGLQELEAFIKGLTSGTVELSQSEQSIGRPEAEVAVDLKAEEGDQRNADSGNSTWKLDPVFTAQVFVSLKISPEGIKGDYPIDYKDLRMVQNTGKTSVVEVLGSRAPVKTVYLKRLIRQDSTGIWTVVGFDPR